MAVPDGYESIAAKLITYKDNNFKVFFGGPIVRPGVALWICPVVFEDSALKVKSVYDVIFVNCIPSQAKGAKIYYIEARDTDLRFKNTNNDTYKTFSSLINGKQFGKCVVIRKSDVAMVTYPNVFIDFDCRTAEKKELDRIVDYLADKALTQRNAIVVRKYDEHRNVVSLENKDMILFEKEKVISDFRGERIEFYVSRILLKNDKWKLYYLIEKSRNDNKSNNVTNLRIDSGCLSGQVYEDYSCDCLDQFFEFLNAHGGNSVIVQVPFHDGMGLGFALRAETEIYKCGGVGAINSTTPLDAKAAARLLYRVNDDSYDIRDYAGVISILKILGYKNLCVFTNNARKLNALSDFNVTREPSDTIKSSFIDNIIATEKR